MVISTFKSNRRIVCYIYQDKKTFLVLTGKPSDNSCIEFCRTDDYEYARSEALSYLYRYSDRG